MPVLDTFFFYAFALLALAGGVATITRRSAVHSAVALIVSLLGVAGLYLLQSAEFLFAVQIILYIGGIMVLFLFVIMLVNLDQAAVEKQFGRQWPAVILCVLALAAEVAWFLRVRGQLGWDTPSAAPAAGNTEQIAELLFTDYLLPFEVISLLLLAAVVGSVYMSRKPG